MAIRIRKSHGGKFLVSHKSVHYHDIMANTLLQRGVARSGNMHVRHSFKHFLNVKMASYALPSFKPLSGRHIGKDCVQPDMSCHSGIVRELDKGLTPEMYLNMSSLACTDGVRFVRGGQFYRVNLRNGRLSKDDSFTRKQYPFGIYYGWFKVKEWSTSKTSKTIKTQNGYICEKLVRGFLLQKRTANFLCGRIVWVDEKTSRKRTNNTYSREVEFSAETSYFVNGELKQGNFRRCPSKTFVPSRPMFYIPFEAYDALPFIDAFIPVNFRNPVKAGIELPSTLSLSYTKNVKWVSTAPGASASSSGSLFMEDPTDRMFEYVMNNNPSETGWITVKKQNNAHIDINLSLKAFENFLNEHFKFSTSTKKGFLVFKYADLKKLLSTYKVTLKSMVVRLKSKSLGEAITQGMTQYTNDMAIYEESQRTPRDKKEFFSEQSYTDTPLYQDGNQVKSIIKTTEESIEKPIRIVTSTTTYTTVINKYDFASGSFISRSETQTTQVHPVSTLLLGGKEVFSEMAMTPVIRAGYTMKFTPKIAKNLIKAYNEEAAKSGVPQLSQYIFNPRELLRSITYDAKAKCLRNLRIDTKDPKGDTIPVTLDSMLIGFSLPSALKDEESEGDDYYIALINSSGKCIFIDSLKTFANSVSMMENEILTSFFKSEVKVPASKLTGYDASDVDANGNITFSLAPGWITNLSAIFLLLMLIGIYNMAIPTTTYLLSLLVKCRDQYVKNNKTEKWILSDAQRDKYTHYIENGYLPISNYITGLINWNVGSGFQKGVYDMNVLKFNNKLQQFKTKDGTYKVCAMEPDTVNPDFYDISSGSDVKFTRLNEDGLGFFTQMMMESINPVTASVLDLEQIPTIIAKFDTPDFVSAGNPANQVHVHLKYGAYPLYQNIGSPFE